MRHGGVPRQEELEFTTQITPGKLNDAIGRSIISRGLRRKPRAVGFATHCAGQPSFLLNRSIAEIGSCSRKPDD